MRSPPRAPRSIPWSRETRDREHASFLEQIADDSFGPSVHRRAIDHFTAAIEEQPQNHLQVLQRGRIVANVKGLMPAQSPAAARRFWELAALIITPSGPFDFSIAILSEAPAEASEREDAKPARGKAQKFRSG